MITIQHVKRFPDFFWNQKARYVIVRARQQTFSRVILFWSAVSKVFSENLEVKDF
jgi:hypothetical protein